MPFSNNSGRIDEAAWIKQYMEITGVSESEARNVFIYIVGNDATAPEKPRVDTNEPSPASFGTLPS